MQCKVVLLFESSPHAVFGSLIVKDSHQESLHFLDNGRIPVNKKTLQKASLVKMWRLEYKKIYVKIYRFCI